MDIDIDERICKYCMVTEHIAQELDKIGNTSVYCAHDTHEWIDMD